MHIGFRTSGGRGEYEVVSDHSGYSARDLEGWTFFMRWPDGIVRDTGLWLDPAGSGKPRLRSLESNSGRTQIGRAIAAMLLAPDPTRTLTKTGEAEPILDKKRYIVSRIGFGAESELSEFAERITFVPTWVQVRNQNHETLLGVTSRWERIQEIYDIPQLLPPTVAPIIKKHKEYLSTGAQIGPDLPRIIDELIKALDADSGIPYKFGADPLETLEHQIQRPGYAGPTLPPPDILGHDEPDISVRAAREYRMVRSRGTEARHFSRAVRSTYRDTCAFCGIRLGGLEGIPTGIDAAHILAWSQYELDVVRNGIALCKIHHWAFDAGLIVPEPHSDTYRIRFTSLAESLDSYTKSLLAKDGDIIPASRLPHDKADWPSHHYLERLYADLGVELPPFIASER